MIYIAFVFALALACLATMLLIYLLFMESANRELTKRVRFLERRNLHLSAQLNGVGSGVVVSHSPENQGDAWPEYIEDSRPRPGHQ